MTRARAPWTVRASKNAPVNARRPGDHVGARRHRYISHLGGAALGGLGTFDLLTGIWAIMDPAGWQRFYPGFGRMWVVAQGGGLNDHLAADVGAGFFAVGAVMIAAAVLRHHFVALALAAVAASAHALPHFLFHLTHPPARQLPPFDRVVGVWGLALKAAIGVVVAAAACRELIRERHDRT